MASQVLRKVGNSTGLTIPLAVLGAAEMARDDAVVVCSEKKGEIVITKVASSYDEEMRLGRECMARYARALRELAK